MLPMTLVLVLDQLQSSSQGRDQGYGQDKFIPSWVVQLPFIKTHQIKDYRRGRVFLGLFSGKNNTIIWFSSIDSLFWVFMFILDCVLVLLLIDTINHPNVVSAFFYEQNCIFQSPHKHQILAHWSIDGKVFSLIFLS